MASSRSNPTDGSLLIRVSFRIISRSLALNYLATRKPLPVDRVRFATFFFERLLYNSRATPKQLEDA